MSAPALPDGGIGIVVATMLLFLLLNIGERNYLVIIYDMLYALPFIGIQLLSMAFSADASVAAILFILWLIFYSIRHLFILIDSLTR